MIKNKVFVDLDTETELPKLTEFPGQIDIKKNGKIIVKNSVLENIDTLNEQDLEYILTHFKQYIAPIITSIYIPTASMMEIIKKVAPEFKVRFKTEKAGTNKIIAISPKEFFEGEKIFNHIIKGINTSWNDKKIYRYLYNQTGIMLSYDLNVLSYTENARLHEKYARNIFTAILKNCGICDSFAAIYDYLCYRSNLDSTILSEDDHDYVMITDANGGDYLTDPTFDSARLKFGLKTVNYAISKENFEKNSHNLKESEADEYNFSVISEKELEELDSSIGYLENFGGTYTDETLSRLANDLEGSNVTEKTIDFMNRLKDIKTIGRPTDSDYIEIIRWILSKSHDKECAERIEVSSFVYEEIKELPRRILFKITEKQGQQKFFEFDYKTKIFNEMNEIKVRNLNSEVIR